jgi:ABC-2 type transport system permease protein
VDKIMVIRRIKAVLLQEFFITLRSYEILFDVFVFSLVSLLLFGFLSLYLTGSQNTLIAQYLLIGMLLWEIVRITQYSLSMGSMWNIWSRNLSNMFISPVTSFEYFSAHTLSGITKSLLVFTLNATVTIFVFHFNIFQLGFLNLFLYFISLTIFSFSVGIMLLALIFRFGTRIQAFTWGFVPILQPLTGAFFPVSVLPSPIKELALLFPNTHVFEAARYTLTHHTMDVYELSLSFLLNILYVIIAIFFFRMMFRAAKDSGQFARNEG